MNLKIKFEDVKNQSTEEYFEDNKFSIDVFNKKYANVKENKEKETYVEAIKRVCDFIASCEKTDKEKKYWSERWFDEIYSDWWHPAGSIIQGAGSGKNISLANCTYISLGIENDIKWDSLEGLIKNTAYTISKTAAFRQGLGVDFSQIRPKETSVMNSSNVSQGSLHWMKFMDSIGYFVGQQGRIPAMLFSLSIKHPDIIDFIKIKKDFTKIQNANLSIQITDDFYTCVEKDEEWEMKFVIPEEKKGDKIYVDVHSTDMNCTYDKKTNKYYYIAKKNRKKEVLIKKENARTILELIAKNMYNNAEPAIQNIDLARKYSNSDYVYNENDEYDSRIIGTNACSEQYLSRESLCVLASLNVGKFSIIKEEYETQLSIYGESINRFLDNTNQMELNECTYATPHQKLSIEKLRRIGAGSTNWGEWLFKNNLEYGSKEANSVMYEFNKTYNYYLYKSSINLGKEKGNFGLFDKDKYQQSPFIKKMKKMGLEFNTMRNVTCSSIAPTGTLSLLFRRSIMSYGVEPSFGIYFWKRTRISGKYEYYFCVPRIVREKFEECGYKLPMNSDTIKDDWEGSNGKKIMEHIINNIDKTGILFKKSSDISTLDKIELMSKLMEYCDSSISVTYMLPENTKWKDVYDFILLARKKGIKSISAFPDKKMYGIVSNIPFKKLAFNLKEENVNIHIQNFSDEELKELNFSKNIIIPSINSVKREKELDCDIYCITVKGNKYIFAVGLQNKQPYEMFGGSMNKQLSFNFNYKKGKIIKVKRGQYKLEIDDMIVIENFSEQFTPIEQMLFRLISTNLRHGVPVKFVVDQLNKSTDDITSLTSASTRVLKKYVKNGEEITGYTCPSCNNNKLVFMEGCITCPICEWSKCG